MHKRNRYEEIGTTGRDGSNHITRPAGSISNELLTREYADSWKTTYEGVHIMGTDRGDGGEGFSSKISESDPAKIN